VVCHAPVSNAALKVLDVVSQPGQVGRRERAPVPDAAIDHDLPVAGQFADTLSKFLDRDQVRTFDCLGRMFCRRPYVEQQKIISSFDLFVQVLGCALFGNLAILT
jgi:hypothetical protein